MSLFGNNNNNNLFGNNQNNNNNLFGNNQNNNNNLFGNNQNNNNNLFGNNQNNNNNNLFGNNNQNNNNNNLFGNNNNNNNLFGNNNQNNNLFGNNNNQNNNLFGNNQNNNNLFGNNQNNNNQQQNNNNNNNNLIFNQNANNQAYINEIYNLFCNFYNSMNTQSQGNIFKFYLYNKIPLNKDPSDYIQYHQYIQTEDNSINFIDYNLWKNAFDLNPNKNKFYPTQISSPKQFLEKIKTSKINIFSAYEDVFKLQKEFEDLNNKEKNDIKNQLNNARNNEKKIKDLLMQTSIKMAKLGIKMKKFKKNEKLEKKIDEKIISTDEKCVELKKIIDDLKSDPIEKYYYINDNNNNQNIDENEMNFNNNEDIKISNKISIKKNLNILKELKGLIDVLYDNLSQNVNTIKGISKDLISLARYNSLE